jgi:hypothetical protein
MTNIATIYGQMISRLGGTLFLTSAGHARIPDPYDLPRNNGQILKQGWGLAISPGLVNTNRFICATRSISAGFSLHLTRRYYATEHDAVKKAAVDTALLTDFEAFIDDAWKNNLGIDSESTVAVAGAFGVQSIFAEDAPYRVLTANFTVEYFRRN